jgi:hypothetical protein
MSIHGKIGGEGPGGRSHTQNKNAPLRIPSMAMSTHVGGFSTPGLLYVSKVCGLSIFAAACSAFHATGEAYATYGSSSTLTASVEKRRSGDGRGVRFNRWQKDTQGRVEGHRSKGRACDTYVVHESTCDPRQWILEDAT